MKKYALALFFLCFISHLSFAQNVGIGTTTPADRLTVKTASSNFGFSHTDGTVTVGSYISSGRGWLGTKSNHPLSFYTNNSGQQMTLTTNGNFGIGSVAPDYRLNVTSTVPASNTNTNLLKLTGQNPLMAFSNGATDFGYIKAWSYQPSAPFTNGLVIGSAPGYPIFFSTNNYSASMEVADNGNVGIGITNPANKLQIGSVGATGFSTNDFAIGNGTNALGIFQSDASTYIGSTTDILIMPKNNGLGRVGINTTTPRAPLEVDGTANQTNYNSFNQYAYFTLGFNNFNPVDAEGGVSDNTIPNVSIYASNRMLASQFNAFSDARIKNIVGVSNSTKDLQTINNLKITDYTFKDKVKYGDKAFKKVIAQEVEEVYPQVVSTHTDFIPNVYLVTSEVGKLPNGYLLTFAAKHNISKAAKKLRILLPEGEGMQQFDIVSIPSENSVIIKADNLKTARAFVYGEEVNDFRTVDYEGLTTLNISATQELSKLVKKQQEAINMLIEEIKKMKATGIASIK